MLTLYLLALLNNLQWFLMLIRDKAIFQSPQLLTLPISFFFSALISSSLCVHSDLHTLAELFFKYAQRASILDMSLHYSVPRCGGLSRSLLSLGYLLRCYFLNEAFPHTLFKMALPLSLFLNCILCRIHHPWTNYICTYFY